MRLTLEHVSYSYGRRVDGHDEPAVSDISLEVVSGEVLGVVGRTGSGKSTLLDVVAHLVKPSAGHLLLDGRSLGRDIAARGVLRRELGYVFQQPERQFFEPTVEREVTFSLRSRGASEPEARERAAAALAEVGLSLDELGARSPFALSGGQQRRVALASVLACRPGLLLLDEPTAGLDPRTRQDVLAAVRGAAKAGAAVMMVSHDADALATVADRVAILVEGRLALEGPVRELLGNAALMRGYGLEAARAAVCAEALAAAGLDVGEGLLTAPELASAIVAAREGVC